MKIRNLVGAMAALVGITFAGSAFAGGSVWEVLPGTPIGTTNTANERISFRMRLLSPNWDRVPEATDRCGWRIRLTPHGRTLYSNEYLAWAGAPMKLGVVLNGKTVGADWGRYEEGSDEPKDSGAFVPAKDNIFYDMHFTYTTRCGDYALPLRLAADEKGTPIGGENGNSYFFINGPGDPTAIWEIVAVSNGYDVADYTFESQASTLGPGSSEIRAPYSYNDLDPDEQGNVRRLLAAGDYLRHNDYIVETLKFDDVREETRTGEEYWRVVSEAGDDSGYVVTADEGFTPTVADTEVYAWIEPDVDRDSAAWTDPANWTENDYAVTIPSGASVMNARFRDPDGTERYHRVYRIKLGSTASYRVPLHGQHRGRTARVVLASTPHYNYLQDGTGTFLLDYRTAQVYCDEPAAPTVAVSLADLGADRTIRYGADGTYADARELKVWLNQATNEDMKVKLTFAWGEGGKETAFPTNVIAISTDPVDGYLEKNLLKDMEVTIPAGATELPEGKKLYLFVLGATSSTENRNEGITITPVPEAKFASFIQTTNAQPFRIVGMNPDIISPLGTKDEPVALTEIRGGSKLKCRVTLDDSWRNMNLSSNDLAAAGGYTVRWNRGYGAELTITNDYSGAPLKPVMNSDGHAWFDIGVEYTSVTGTYHASFIVTNPEGHESVVSYVDVTTIPRATVAATLPDIPQTADGFYETMESDTDKRTVRFQLSDILEADGQALWAFLEPANEAASNRTDGAFFTKRADGTAGTGVPVDTMSSGMGSTALNYKLGGIQVLDGDGAGDGSGSTAQYNVILCTQATYDAGKVFGGYDGANAITLLLDNHEPEVTQLKMEGSSRYLNKSGATTDVVRINVSRDFTPKAISEVTADLDAPDELQVVFRWRLYEIDDGDENVEPNEVVYTVGKDSVYTMPGLEIGGMKKIVVQMQDKDMRPSGKLIEDPTEPNGWKYVMDKDDEEHDWWEDDANGWGPEFVIYVPVNDKPTVDIVAVGGAETLGALQVFTESQLPPSQMVADPNMGFLVTLSEPYTKSALRVRLELQYQGKAATKRVDDHTWAVSNGYVTVGITNLVFSKNSKTSGSKVKNVSLTDFDGTWRDDIKRNGYALWRLIATVYDPEAATEEQDAGYVHGACDFYVRNEAPQVYPDSQFEECTDRANARTVSRDPFTIGYTLSDIDADLTNGMKVVCSVSGGEVVGESTLVATGGVNVSSGEFTVKMTAQGVTNSVTITATDKDGDSSNVKLYFFVEKTKNLYLYPAKPATPPTESDYIADYFSASGIGYGRVWAAEDTSTLDTIDGFMQSWERPDNLDTPIFAFALGYMANEKETDSGRKTWVDMKGGRDKSKGFYQSPISVDSFFYRWFAKIASDKGSDNAWTPYKPVPMLSKNDEGDAKAQTRISLAWPKETSVGTTVYNDIQALAIFSRELLWSDNMGDINADGVPDSYVLKYKLVEDYTGGADLKDVNFAEDGKTPYCQDYLPQTDVAKISDLVRQVLGDDTSTDNLKNATAFTPRLKLRGYDDNLNDAVAEYLPNNDGTKTKNQAFIDGAKPEKIYADPDTCPTSTLSKVEFLAWSEFATAKGLDPKDAANWSKWSPERPTDPTKADTDNDGLTDGIEYYWWYRAHVGWLEVDANGNEILRKATGRRYNPKNPAEGDLITSAEIERTFDPIQPFGDAAQDTDGDGLPDLLEFEIGTNPFDFDTDGDGLPDGWEVMFSGTKATDPYTTEGQFDAARNYDGDAMAITSPALEDKLAPKPTKIDKLYRFALVDPNGDTDGVQWYVAKANPKDFAVKDTALTGTVFTANGKTYVTTAGGALVTPQKTLARDLLKDCTWEAQAVADLTNSIPCLTNVAATAGYVALMPADVLTGTKAAITTNGVEYVTLALAGNVSAMTAWPYGKKMTIVDEAGKELPGGFGFLAVGRYPSWDKDDKTLAPTDRAIAALPEKDDAICYLHSLVYQEFGFDPRTAWCAKSELNGRSKMGNARKSARTRAYTAYDEFLVYSFLVNTGMGDRLFAKLDDKAPEIARVWAAETTNPQGPNEPDIDVSGAGAGENARAYYGKNSDQGADTDLDGIPDGWELYIMAGPKDPMTDEYVFVGADCQFGPFKDFGASEKTSGDPNLTERENYAGTDSCNYYVKPVDGAETAYSTTITRPDTQAKWLNKFFPTDPWAADTDGDGLTDDVESGKNIKYLGTKVDFWAGQFVYGDPADNGAFAAIPGGGLNPCAIDTDYDGLPDAWEAQFAGSKVYSGDHAAYAPDADGNQGNPLQGLVDGMDGTVPDAYNSVKNGEEIAPIRFLGNIAMPQDVDRDYDHDGLENWQEYLTGTMRCWRYDDPLSRWDYIPQSWYYDENGAFRPWREGGKYLKLLGLNVKRGASAKDLEAQFWYETLFNAGGPAYNPHLVTEVSSGAQYFTRVSNLWDPCYDLYYVLYDRVGDKPYSGIWGDACYGSPIMMPLKYVSCSPIKADSDNDGMDDYYEVFHGLNPLLGQSGVAADSEGPCDLVYDAWYDEAIGGYEWKNRGIVQNSPVNAMANRWTDDPLATRGRLPRVNPDIEEIEGANANVFDFELFPWLNGLATADPDGDDIRNQSEAIMALVAPSSIWSHTDPTPLWMTDSSYTNSLVYRFFRLPATFGEGTSLTGPTFTYNGREFSFRDRDGYYEDTTGLFPVYLLKPFQPDHWGLLGESAQNWFVSFEENEGYDSDHDAIADNDELSGAFKVASDPQDFDSPHRRQAMYFPGKDAALQSLPETAEDHPRRSFGYPDEPAFVQYTVECWVMPETVSATVPQTVIERAVWTDWSNGGDQELLRRNFQIAIRSGLWYTKFDSGTLSGTCVEVLSDVPAEAGKWTHVAATYGNGVLKLYVNGVAVDENGKDGKGLKPEYGSSAVVVHPGENNAHTNGIYLGRGDGYWYDRDYALSAFLIGASFKGLADIGYHTSHLNVENGAGWSRYKDFFNGWIDEVRVWDGARSSGDIKADMMKRYTAADVKANRDAFYGEWAAGKRRYDKDGNGKDVEMIPELRYHWSFDSVPGAANAASAAKAAHGFGWNAADGTAYAGVKAPYSRPVGYGIGWWMQTLAGYGSVYDNPEYVTWIPNTLAHLPRFDGTTLDSFYWAEDIEGDTPGTYRFARTAEPVSRWTQYVCHQARTVNMGRDGRSMDFETTSRRYWIAYNAGGTNAAESAAAVMYEFTGRHLNQKGDDLLPLGGAYVRYVSAMWDEQGPSTAWEITGEDANANRLPDWWERYAIENYNPADPDNMDWNTLVDYNGLRIPAGQAYLYDLAKGYHAGADGNIVIDPAATAAFASRADEDKDGIPDFWEEMTGLHDGSTDLTVGHAWGDPDNDGLANVSEYAASTGALLGVGRELKPVGATGRCTDGFVIDYFRRLADGRYLGEVQGIADHDMMEDAWEDLYDVTRANRWIWDALADRDRDGWSNYAECRAGTDPTRVSSLIFEGIEKIDFPIPTVELTLNRPAKAAGGDDTVVIEAWQGSDTTGEPDAVWTVGSGYSGAKSRFLGRNTGRTLTFNCGPGSVVPGSFKLSFKDPTADSIEWASNKTEIVQSLKVSEGENVWASSVLDMQRSDGGTIGDVVWRGDGDTFIGTIDYQTGLVTVDLSKVAGWDWNTWIGDTHCIRTYIDKSYLRADWTSKMLERSVDTTLYLSEADKGALREGPNTFIAKSADGSLLGVARNVNVGWSEVKDLVIDLTAESAVFPRFEAGSVAGEPALVKIVRKSINGIPSEKIVMRKRGVEGRHLFTEADFVRPGEFDLDWTTLAPAAAKAGILAWDFTEVEYEVTVDGRTLDTFTKTFESVRTKPETISFSPAADQDNLLLSVSPTFRWTGPAGYTAFRLQVSTNEDFDVDAIVYDSDARFLPVLRDGTYEFAADCYLNEHLADGQTYFWRVAMLNAKFADAEGGWSAAATFTVAADSTRLNTGYGKAAVDVRYYGSNDCTRADVVVGLYRSADFTDAPVALQHLADGDLALLAVTNVRGCVAFTTNSVALFDGLKPGKYYAMAFIDANTNGVRDAWESWGYFNNIGTERTDLYTPMTIDVVANRAVRGECVLFMEDTDVNKDGVPDCWQDLSDWSQVAPSVEDADLDGDGLPDDWEDLMGDGAAGFPTDDPETDAAYAAAGDVMAYAEVDRVLVTFADGTQALVMKGVLKRPTVGDLAASCNEGWYEDVYAYGDRIGLGLPFHIFDTELRITKVEDVKVVLVHAQVYDAFGYNMKTANAEAFAAGVAVNTKEFTALDKYLVWTYLRVIGYTDEEEENWLNWQAFTLKPGTVDQNLDGVADGWNLYVMFGPATVFAAYDPAMAPCTPWMDAGVARDEDHPTPGGEGLTWVQEYDGGHYPTDPWQWSTIGDRFRDGYGEEQTISDKDAYAYFLKHYAGEEGDKYADFDNDGLANYDEYDIMKNNNRALAADNMFSYFGSETVPALAGQCVPDYFLKSQRRNEKASLPLYPIYDYLGFDYTSHDFIESWWKDQYTAILPNSQEKYVDRTRFETYDDPDADGWDNWSEDRAGMDPTKIANVSIDGYETAEYPVPVISTTIRYFGDGNIAETPIVLEARRVGTDATIPDARWVIGQRQGSEGGNADGGSAIELEKFVGMNPKQKVRLNFGPGLVVPSSLKFKIKDPNYSLRSWQTKNGNVVYDLGIDHSVDSATWMEIGNDRTRVGDLSIGDIMLKNQTDPIGWINYATGEAEIDYTLIEAEFTLGSAETTTITEGSETATVTTGSSTTWHVPQSYFMFNWKGKTLSAGNSTQFAMSTPEAVSDRSNGLLREGLNTFVAFADANGNGAYDPGEAFGCAENVQVGWDRVVDLSINLAKTSPVLPRFNPMDIGEGAGTNGAVTVEYKGKPVISDLGEYQTVRIVRWEINGDECAHRTVLSKTAETLGTITEADVLSDNSFDLDWNYLEIDAAKIGYGLKDISTITYAVFVDGLTLSEVKEENVTGWIVKGFPGIRGKATPVAPLAGYKTAIVTATRPTFEFWAPEGYPAFAFELRDEYGNVVFESTEHIGAKNAAGNVTYRPPVFFEDNGAYTWRVAMLNAKYRAAGDWSEDAAFTVELAKGKVEDTDKGALDVAVRYYGDATGPIIVQAFRTADFTGVPEGQTVVFDTGVFDFFDPIPDCLDSYVDTNTVNAKIYGLAPGDYYICAFIDETGDLKRRRWESWGYVNNVGTDKRDLYTPVATKVMRNDTSTALLFIEDADCDNDGVPDWMDPPDGWDWPYPPPPYIPPVTPPVTPPSPPDVPPVRPPDVPPWFPQIDPPANDVMAYEDLKHTLLVKIGKTDEDPASQWYAVMDLEGEGWKLRDSDIPLETFATNIESLVSTWAMGAYTGIGTNVTFTGDERVWDTKFETVRLIHAQVYAKNGYNTLTANGQAYAAGKSVNTKPFTYADKYYVCRYLENIGVEGFSEAKMIAEVEKAIATAVPADVEWAARKVWRKYALDPDYIDMDRNDVDDGWEMYVMFGVTDLGVFTDVSAHGHWTKDGLAISPWNPADGMLVAPGAGSQLKLVEEFDGGFYPTDPWHVDTDRDGVIDFYAYQYCLKGDQAGEDLDGDGLSNLAEYYISEVFKVAKLDPKNPKTDGFCVDYFRKMGDLYVGEIFTDHDQVDDIWEAGYDKVANRYVYDPDEDLDRDGWSNYAEFRAGSDPTTGDAYGVDEYTRAEYPVPVIEAKVIYNGNDVNLGSIVFKAWNDAKDPDMTSAPDAIWTIGNGKASETTATTEGGKSGSTLQDYEKYVGRKPSGVQRYALGGGTVGDGTIEISFLNKQFTDVSYPSNAVTGKISSKPAEKPGDPSAAKWYLAARDDGNGHVVTLTGERIGTVDYAHGVLTVDFGNAAICGPTTGDRTTGYAYATEFTATEGNAGYDAFSFDDAHVLVKWQAKLVGLTADGVYTLGDADAVGEGAKSHGHVREGLNTFICFADTVNANGVYDPGEPFGVVRGVDVGWQGAKFTVELTETSPITDRIRLTDNADDREATIEGSLSAFINDRMLWAIPEVLKATNDAQRAELIAFYSAALSNRVQRTTVGAGMKSRIRVVRYGIDDWFCYSAGVYDSGLGMGYDQRVVMEKEFDMEGRDFVNEADFLDATHFDIDWGTMTGEIVNENGAAIAGVSEAGLGVTNMTYLVVKGDGAKDFRGSGDTNTTVYVAGVISRRFELTRHVPKIVSPSVGAYVHGARPTFRWSIPDEEPWAARFGSSYTAFRIQISKANGGSVYDSGIRRAPAQTEKGVFEWTADAFAGDQLPVGNYTWKVSMYNAKFRSDAWSLAGSFSIATGTQQETDDHNYSSIDVSVKYTGPALVLNEAGFVRVQAFETADFSGTPVAQTRITDTASVRDAGDIRKNGTLVGLPFGTYFVRAYIDTNKNGVKDDWESWGGTKEPITLTTYQPAPIDGLYIEDADTDQDWLPDAWEYAKFGNLSKKGAEIDPEGRIVLKQVVCDDLAKGQANISKFLSGASLTFFQNIGNVSLALGIDAVTEKSIAEIRAMVEKNIDPTSVKITSLTVDATSGKVYLTVAAKATDSIAGYLLEPLYEIPKSTDVTIKIYRKENLATDDWTLEKTVSKTIESTLSAKVEVDTGINFNSGFYKVEVVRECEE